METLSKKIDFVLFVAVNNANPNGDPLLGNMPRTDYNGYGEISDVCIKRKIRNRLQDMGQEIFVQASDRIEDNNKSLQERFEKNFKKESDEEVRDKSCKKWIDVRSFGQVMTFQKRSIGIRGPVSISLGKSLDPVDIVTLQITRSTNGMNAEAGKSRSSDTMGTKHFVDFGVYRIEGSINCYFAKKTGFSSDDAELIKNALISLFENDMSSARPEGSMEVLKLYWFVHPNELGITSSAKIYKLVISELSSENHEKNTKRYILKLDMERLTSYRSKGLNLTEYDGK